MSDQLDTGGDTGTPLINLPTTPAVGQPLYAPIKHPELRQLGRKQIDEFLQAREQYESQVSAARLTGANIQPVPLTSSVESEILLSLIGMGELQDATKMSDVTDDILLAYLQARAMAIPERFTMETLDKTLKRTVHMNVREPDP